MSVLPQEFFVRTSERNSSRVCLLCRKLTEHGAGDRLAVLLLHAAHLHAQMPCFNNHANAFRGDLGFDGLGDLAGQRS